MRLKIVGFDGPSIHNWSNSSGEAFETLNRFGADIDTVKLFAYRPEVCMTCGEKGLYLLMSKASGEWARGSDVMMNRWTPNWRYSNIMA